MMILMRAIRLNFLSILFSANVIRAPYSFVEVFTFQPDGPPDPEFGIDTSHYTEERRAQECTDGSFSMEGDIGPNPLTGEAAGATLLYLAQSYEGDLWEGITGFRCYAARDFLVQEIEGEEDTILVVSGGPAQPPQPEQQEDEEPEEEEEEEEQEQIDHDYPAENSDVEYEGPYPGPYNGYH